jgi:predicted membrane protein
MSTYSKPKNDGNIAFGFIILGIGVILLLRKIGLFIPSWVLSWPMILIVIGTFAMIKHEFKSFFGAIMLFIGVYFLLTREFDFDFGLSQYIFPLGLIVLGIYLILQKQRENRIIQDIQANWKAKSTTYSNTGAEEAKVVDEGTGNYSKSTESTGFTRTTGTSFADRLNVDAVFSGVNRKVMSKNFQGGKITAAFGGAELDLSSTDFNGVVTIQIDIIFGGVKMIVPPHWDIRTEVSNIAAGIEDKRYFRDGGIDSNKVVILKGTILFGGLEIKSF